ncbi:MAG: tetratricopeptide repeat protein [Usitatibacter sp.]
MRLARSLAVVLCALPIAAFAQPAAEIVSLKGKGDYSLSPAGGWTPAKVQQRVDPGTWLRTQQDSKMSLLLADQTNAAIDANTTLQVKVADGGAARKSIVDFQKGKGRFETRTPTRSFSMATPTGLAAIRGTEWVVEVEDDGRSSFTVVEGEIDISNDQGSLSVGADEQGVLEKGRAPYKRRVQNARERVQWVSSFTIEPTAYAELRRPGPLAGIAESLHAGDIENARRALAARVEKDDAPAGYFLLADIALYRGNAAEAVEWLKKAAARFPAEPRTQGLLARAYLFGDQMELAREAAATARAKYPDTLESQLYAGEVARLDGDARLAGAALRRATQIAPDDWRAWHALGQVYAERSDPRRARRALDRAEKLAPSNATVLGERGLLEANSYDLPFARKTLASAIEAQPDDFASWTGLGVARLKSGDVEGALEALLKATLIEPRYARAHVYLAVAYWQQGRVEDALARLRTASTHDPKDPLPYQFAAMIHSDLLKPGEAVAAAREAMARLRYAKSLDAIANNLRGGANLGTPLAQMGLESWALKSAQDSFDPLWAASHLFLADRLPGKFASNSELMQGFLADPLAFGAPNRFQSLVSRPGTYATVAWRGSQSSASKLTEPLVNVNGLAAEGRIAYFLEGVLLKSWTDDRHDDDRASSVTAAIGLRLTDEFGFFFYDNRFIPDSRDGFQGRSTFDGYRVLGASANRTDAGLLYRRGPDSQLWVKGGHGYEDSRYLTRVVGGVSPFMTYRETDLSSQPRRADLGARATHRLGNGFELSCTAEAATFRTIDYFEQDAFGRVNAGGSRILESVRQDIRDKSASFEVAARTRATDAVVGELQVDRSSYDKSHGIVVRRDFAQQLEELSAGIEHTQWSPRAGAVWKPIAPLTLRGAYQRWLRPASIGSLRPASTAGIVLDDRYVLPGGKFERARVQAEWEATPKVLLTAFADRQEIENLYSSLAGVLNFRPDATNLERLRNRSVNALATLDRLEGFPSLSAGKMTESGFTANALATRQVSLFAEGTWAASENTGAYPGRLFAYLPRRRMAVGATFFSDSRWWLAAKATHRGERFTDEANTLRLAAEWSGAVQAYWESPAKRWSIELLFAGIGAKSTDESVAVALNYRF